jgi:hypothetical protein
MLVGPLRRQQPLLGRQGADGDGAGTAMAVPDARDGLAQLAHIARIVAQQQVFAHGRVERGRRLLCQFGEEMRASGRMSSCRSRRGGVWQRQPAMR